MWTLLRAAARGALAAALVGLAALTACAGAPPAAPTSAPAPSPATAPSPTALAAPASPATSSSPAPAAPSPVASPAASPAGAAPVAASPSPAAAASPSPATAASSAASPSPSPSPSPAAAAPATPASGTITLYTSESEDQVNEMKADFERRNPGVTMNIFRSGSGPVIARVQAERQAGNLQADLVWLADIAFFAQLAREGVLLPYNPPEAANVPAQYRYEDGKYHEVRLIFNVVGYNTARVQERPTSWRDLTRPALKGRIGMPHPNYSGAAMSTLGTLVSTPGLGWEFYEALKANDVSVEQSNGTVAQKLASGEYAMVSVVDFMVRNFKNQGAPVDHIWPVEGAVLVPTPIGITASSKNPDAARAFLRYLYSPEGQRLFVKQGYVAVLPGIEPPQGAPSLADVRIAPTAEAFIAANREELKARFQSLFGG